MLWHNYFLMIFLLIICFLCSFFFFLSLQVRTGYFEGKNRIDSLIEDFGNWGATAVTIHGRTRQQRYSKLADWEYIYTCARAAPHNLQVLGNGDVFSYLDWSNHKSNCPELSSCMIGRGALIKVGGVVLPSVSPS